MSGPACPVCGTVARGQREATPYWICHSCGLWFQSPLPPKAYHGPDKAIEYDVDAMPERDVQINRAIARWLFDDLMKGAPGPTLDVGSKHPVLARAFLDLGCDAYAIEPQPPLDNLGVTMFAADFETVPASYFASAAAVERFRLITLIHVFEHFYDPVGAMTKLRAIVAEDGHLFIRSPDSSVTGIERDLTPHHFAIHPFVWSPSALAELLSRLSPTFRVTHMGQMKGAGQTDFFLRPI